MLISGRNSGGCDWEFLRLAGLHLGKQQQTWWLALRDCRAWVLMGDSLSRLVLRVLASIAVVEL